MLYDIEPHIAELYDRSETYTDDVELIRKMIGGCGPLRILEPFCGTGRILVPLALDGHLLVGMDRARGMLARAQAKIDTLPKDARRRITLVEADVLEKQWPQGFDLVILGGNCFYELGTPHEQEYCIASAAAVLNRGGHVYIDNDHMEGALDETWRQPGAKQAFPTGVCQDGTSIESTMEVVWHDAPARLVRLHRLTQVTLPDGQVIEKKTVQQKHPVSAAEVQTWLDRHGFVVERLAGDRAGSPYLDTSPRAIFWAGKL